MKFPLLFTLVLAFSAFSVGAQTFTVIDTLRKGAYGAAVWGDFDGDGLVDLAYGSQTASTGEDDSMNIYRNTGSGFAKVAQEFPYTPNPAMAAADLDGDGKDELLYCGFFVDSMLVYTANEAGGYSILQAVHLPATTSGSLAITDYNNDGFPDIFIAGFDTGSQQIARIYKGGPGLTFTDIEAPLTGFIFGEAKWGDYDGDGLADLITNGEGALTGEVRVYRNMGADSFLLTAQFTGGRGTADWIDYDEDGAPDFVVTYFDGVTFFNETKLYHNTGAGSFMLEATSNLPAFGEPSAVAIADFNGDGHQDILLTGGSAVPGLQSILALGTGSSQFVSDTIMASDIINCFAETADLNNDGKPDLVLSNFILKNNSGVSISTLENSNGDLRLFPNPFSETATLQWKSTETGVAKTVVMDAVGRTVFSEKVAQQVGENSVLVDFRQRVAGVYFVGVETGGERRFLRCSKR